MEIKPREVDRFCKAPPDHLSIVVLFGSDRGLIHERAGQIAAAWVGPDADTMAILSRHNSEIKDDPARLGDFAGSMSMFGGRQAMRVSDADNNMAKRVKRLTEDVPGENLIILEGPGLAKTGSLAKAAIGAGTAAAIGCYEDLSRDLGGVIQEVLSAAGLTARPDAMAGLMERLGEDRVLSRRMLDTLALYKGRDLSPVTAEDVAAALGPAENAGLSDLTDLVAAGDTAGALRAWGACVKNGTAAGTATRALANHFRMLSQIRIELDKGGGADQIARRNRLHFTRKDIVMRAAQNWINSNLDTASNLILQAELETRRHAILADALVERAILNLCRLAPGRRR